MNFYKKWKEFLLKETVLKEISSEDLELVDDVLYDIKPEQLPFNEEFDGKMRVVEPFYMESKEIIELKEVFEMFKFVPDWGAGTVTKKYNAVYNGRNMVKGKTLKIGKFLNKLIELKTKAGGLSLWNEDQVEEFKKVLDQYKKLVVSENTSPEELRNEITYYVTNPSRLKRLYKYWQEHSETFKKNPNLAEEKVHTHYAIITRHPIDIIRMSDHSEITSCHTPLSTRSARGDDDSEVRDYAQYFACAVQDARHHSPVVFLVPKEEWDDNIVEEEIDPNTEKEIFTDDSRGTGYVEPIARTRLRRFINKNDPSESLMIPDLKAYSDGDIPGFIDYAETWAKEKQADKRKKVKEEAQREDGKYDFGDFKATAYYFDTNPGNLFRSFFKDSPDEQMEFWANPTAPRTTDDIESNLRDRFRDHGEDLQNELEEIEGRYDFTHVNAGFEVENYGDGPYASFWGSFSVNFNFSYPEGKDPGEVDEEIQEYVDANWETFFGDIEHHFESYEVGFAVSHETATNYGTIEFTAPMATEVTHGAEGFEEFMAWCEEVDDYLVKSAGNDLTNALSAEGLIEKSATQLAREMVEDEDEIRYDGYVFKRQVKIGPYPGFVYNHITNSTTLSRRIMTYVNKTIIDIEDAQRQAPKQAALFESLDISLESAFSWNDPVPFVFKGAAAENTRNISAYDVEQDLRGLDKLKKTIPFVVDVALRIGPQDTDKLELLKYMTDKKMGDLEKLITAFYEKIFRKKIAEGYKKLEAIERILPELEETKAGLTTLRVKLIKMSKGSQPEQQEVVREFLDKLFEKVVMLDDTQKSIKNISPRSLIHFNIDFVENAIYDVRQMVAGVKKEF